MKFVVMNLPVRYKHKKYNVGDVLEIEEIEFKNLKSKNLKRVEIPKNNQKKTEVALSVSENNVVEKKEDLKEEVIDTKEDLKEKNIADKKKSGGKK